MAMQIQMHEIQYIHVQFEKKALTENIVIAFVRLDQLFLFSVKNSMKLGMVGHTT